jgi:Tfp pilus assembly protein PilF
MTTDKKNEKMQRMQTWLKMNALLICFMFAAASMILLLTGCGGTTEVNTNINIPDLQQTEYTDTPYEEGWKFLKTGKPDRAIKSFERSNVKDEQLFLGYGYAFLAQNKYDLARKNFDKCLKINPENLQAQYGIATMYELRGQPGKAFLVYSKLRASNPENAWVKVRYESIKAAETEKYLKKARQHKEVGNDVFYIEALQAAARFSPEIVDIKIEIADYYLAQEDYDLAAKAYEEVLEKVPNNENILLKLAGVYEQQKKYDSAILIYRKMLEWKPGDLSITNKITDLQSKFYELNLPVKFKNIFFKDKLTREDLAALLGYYFDKYLEAVSPVIITDIGGSFAKEYIIRVCSLELMKLRPDHSFDRYATVDRAAFAVVMDSLIKYLNSTKGEKFTIQFTPLDEAIEPADITPAHRYYSVIKFLVNSDIMKLNEAGEFGVTEILSPSEALAALKKILNGVRDRY